MVTFACINAGNYLGLGSEYVNRLYDMVLRNLEEGYKGQFVVFTDCPDGYDKGIVVRPLPVSGLQGWWNKLSLFKSGVFAPYERVIYMDLDTVIAGRLDEIAAYSGKFAILRDFYRPDGLQSSVMAWEAGDSHIWDSWDEADRPEIDGGDQAWIEKVCCHRDIWQDMYPDRFVSYKVSGGMPPEKASVVVFHGEPRPHEVLEGWVPDVWKVGGLSRAELTLVCNNTVEAYMRNVRENSTRDIPWFAFQDQHDNQVAIVGGSPSIDGAIDEIEYRASLGQEIWALNGAYSYLCDNGIKPNRHIIIDSREENVRFIEPDPFCRYIIASQCHPIIFDMLDGLDVTLCHMLTTGMEEYLSTFETDKPINLIGGGTTVGIKAMVIAHRLGFRKIHLYGMDSCYMDDRHHAYTQTLNDGERQLDVICGGRKFKCAPWMVTQATDFRDLALNFANDTIITVNGNGLLAEIARQFSVEQPITAADIRAKEILARLNGSDVCGAEIGVFCGELSRRLLSKPNLRLHMVDSWGDYDDTYKASGDFHAEQPMSEQDRYYKAACEAVRNAADRAVIHKMRSEEAAKNIGDGELDFVFIDADHSEEGCKRDILAWLPKIKPGGFISGHDYDNESFPQWGVKKAVDEFAASNGLQVELGDNYTWFIQLGEQHAR